MVRHEESVEFAAFERLSKTRDVAEIEVGVRIGTGLTPPCGVDTDGAHERA